MLKGHDSLTRLVGKRRRLSLSGVSPNLRIVKEEVQDVSVVSICTTVKEEVVDSEFSAHPPDQRGTLRIESSRTLVVKTEAFDSDVESQDTYRSFESDNPELRLVGLTSELKRKSRQSTLTQFFKLGLENLLCSSSILLAEDTRKRSLRTKLEHDNDATDPPSTETVKPLSRLKLKRASKDAGGVVQSFRPELQSSLPRGVSSTEDSQEELNLVECHQARENFHKRKLTSMGSGCFCRCHLPSPIAGNVKVETWDIRDEVPDADVANEVVFSQTGQLATDVRANSLDQVDEGLALGVLETRIVGRRYHRKTVCEEGMEVTVLREPQNRVDTNAIQIVPVDSPLGPALGHLPREISCHLSPLLDQGVVRVQGSVTGLSERKFGEVRLRLYFRTANGSTGLTTVDGAEENWQKVVAAAVGIPSNSQSTNTALPKYQQNFTILLRTVMDRDSHLLKEQEREYLGAFYSLTGDAQRLFIRLYQRKGPWFRLSSISYKDVDDIESASEQLISSGLMTVACRSSEEPAVSLRTRLEVLTMPELKQLASLLKMKSESTTVRREELMTLIISVSVGKHQVAEGSDHQMASVVLQMVSDITGSCIRVSEQADFLLWRVQRLFFMDSERDISSFLLVDLGLVKYPKYKCLRSRHVFPTYEGLVAYEQALEIAQQMDMSLEGNDIESALRCLQTARNELGCCEVGPSSGDLIPPFLTRFSAPYVYQNIITVGISLLERERRYKEAVDALNQLLKCKVRSGRWGYWTLRLSINLDHLGCKEESLKVAENGVDEPWIRGGDRVALQRRVVRLGKPPRRWKRPPYAKALNRKCKEVQILGRPLNSVTGMKSRFYGYDGELCGVEDLALQYYGSEEGGCWQGVHCEGGVWMTMFGLIMWDVLFADVADVFQTPFQTAPLDLNTELFYPVRKDMIEARLADVASGLTECIIARTWNENYGTACSGVNWNRHSLAELLVIVRCIGGLGLSHVCRLLAEDHAGWRGGMPDLLLWRTSSAQCSTCLACGCSEQICNLEAVKESYPSKENMLVSRIPVDGEAKLVEVKGPRDRLSEQQTAWIWILMNGGLSVEICKVLEQM